MIRSSANRDRWVAINVHANSTSATKSRSLTASMEFGESASKPSVPWSSVRETGYAEPATAPEPRRQHGRATRRGAEASPVPLERPEVSEQPVCGRDRLGALEVRVRGHQYRLDLSGAIHDHALEFTNRPIEAPDGIHGPQPGGCGDLIVPAASGVKLRCHVADCFVQQPVDHRVHVFVRGRRALTCFETARDRIEAALHGLALVERQDAGVPQRHGPGLGQA